MKTNGLEGLPFFSEGRVLSKWSTFKVLHSRVGTSGQCYKTLCVRNLQIIWPMPKWYGAWQCPGSKYMFTICILYLWWGGYQQLTQVLCQWLSPPYFKTFCLSVTKCDEPWRLSRDFTWRRLTILIIKSQCSKVMISHPVFKVAGYARWRTGRNAIFREGWMENQQREENGNSIPFLVRCFNFYGPYFTLWANKLNRLSLIYPTA